MDMTPQTQNVPEPVCDHCACDETARPCATRFRKNATHCITLKNSDDGVVSETTLWSDGGAQAIQRPLINLVRLQVPPLCLPIPSELLPCLQR